MQFLNNFMHDGKNDGKMLHLEAIFKVSTHFYRIREGGGSGRPPPNVHLRTDDVT